MVNVNEASFFCPTFQMLTRGTVPADLIAGCIEHTTEFDDLVVTLRTSIFAVSQRIEVLQLNPASRGEIPDQSAPRSVAEVLPVAQLTRRIVAGVLASLVCFQAYSGCG